MTLHNSTHYTNLVHVSERLQHVILQAETHHPQQQQQQQLQAQPPLLQLLPAQQAHHQQQLLLALPVDLHQQPPQLHLQEVVAPVLQLLLQPLLVCICLCLGIICLAMCLRLGL